jgi:hypothetical protein
MTSKGEFWPRGGFTYLKRLLSWMKAAGTLICFLLRAKHKRETSIQVSMPSSIFMVVLVYKPPIKLSPVIASVHLDSTHQPILQEDTHGLKILQSQLIPIPISQAFSPSRLSTNHPLILQSTSVWSGENLVSIERP